MCVAFPKVRITGGPHGKNTRLEVDGERVPATTRVEIVADVGDVIRMKTFQLVEAVVEVEGSVQQVVTVRVNQRVPDPDQPDYPRWSPLVEATADTVWQALYDCAKQLERAST